METMRAIIVEDEVHNYERLERLLQKNCPTIEVIGIATTVDQAIDAIREGNPDIVFLDIELPDGTGFDVLDHFENESFSIVFTTAYDHYAIKAIKMGAADYLLKPIERDEMKHTVERLIQQKDVSTAGQRKFLRTALNRSELSQIALPTQEGYIIVEITQVIRCEADANYTWVFLTNGQKKLVSKTLKEYEELLKDNNFCRIHHSHLINMRHAVKYIRGDGGTVIMSDGSEIEVSKRKKERFLKMLPRT